LQLNIVFRSRKGFVPLVGLFDNSDAKELSDNLDKSGKIEEVINTDMLILTDYFTCGSYNPRSYLIRSIKRSKT